MSLDIVVLGLTLSSSWGNGHATTYRALLKAFAARGHRVTFLECDKPWYAAHRDLTDPDYCDLVFYDGAHGLSRHAADIARADAVIVGSYVPDGAAAGRFVLDRARGATAFYDIDTPVTAAALDAGTCAYLTPELAARYGVYLSFTGGPFLRRMAARFGLRLPRALPCSADPEQYAPAIAPRRFDLSYLGTYAPDRQAALEALLLAPARALPRQRFAVAGPQYPDTIDWPENVTRIAHVPPEEHAAFFASSRFTLNLTRAEMVRAGYSPSVRLFEAAACGAAILSDMWDGLESYFDPGREIGLVARADDVVAALTRWSPGRVAAMGRAARARALADHTAAHRAASLESALMHALGRRDSSAARPAAEALRAAPAP